MKGQIAQTPPAESQTPGMSVVDRRKNVRVFGAFAVRMRGIDESGTRFQATALVDNISSSGLYMQMSRLLSERSKLFLLVQLLSGPAVAALGEVARTETRPYGLYGVAVRFSHTRLLPSRVTGTPLTNA